MIAVTVPGAMDDLQSRIQDLGDVELAVLVAVVAGEHCIFSASSDSVQSLRAELSLTCMNRFLRQPVVIDCSPETTVDEFSEALLVENEEGFDDSLDDRYGAARPTLEVKFHPAREPSPGRLGSLANLEERRLADVVIAVGLDSATEAVQVQAFELLRSRRIFTRSAMHVAPTDLLFIVILSSPEARLTRHLNDLFCMSHHHADDDAFIHLEGQLNTAEVPTINAQDITELRDLANHVNLTHEIAQYLHNIVVFMRNSRFIKGGVTATATRQLRILSMALASLHGLDYVSPSLVALAARKIYPHRLVLATEKTERSLLWGSDPRAIRHLMQTVTVEDAIENVLGSVEAPL
ncbi:uncharacterized protein MYCFIDRAFT_210187 [Pseudocercospora fijiensis CIRAD86]|uniref:Magnesium chelatase n=1 Tax=Pseudocercospora fijiensis (strain CIRAD86) TaxID=383855 RepID=M2Z679_PSEFD|nr:uncharacterized protein MYCFIDRAFT_210187 [Pseudocercospora fijiensis CIRAD86]EME85265.1 hypothetical protein MYCFIDRAFT_210187 [Pseudocercospora fijiensis CIRAD86]